MDGERAFQSMMEGLFAKHPYDRDVIGFPEHIKNPDHKIVIDDYDPTMTLHELEKRYILKALNYFDGNKTQAANALGITIKTLYNKLHEYGEFEKYAVHARPASKSAN